MDKDSTICWSALAWGQKKEQCCSSRVALRTRPFEKIMGLFCKCHDRTVLDTMEGVLQQHSFLKKDVLL